MSDLDARIRSEIDDAVTQIKGCDPDTFDAMAADELRDAILAAVDLHAPDSWGDDERPHCTECSGNAGVRIWAPCETVRVIAEKLGVPLP